ncbi:MAG: hypothetical protein ACLR2O_02775 [Coprococcus sp.]
MKALMCVCTVSSTSAIEDVEAAMKGMLEPVFEEKVLGHAEVRQTFKASGVGTIAGSYVLDGTVRDVTARQESFVTAM